MFYDGGGEALKNALLLLTPSRAGALPQGFVSSANPLWSEPAREGVGPFNPKLLAAPTATDTHPRRAGP
ncbi:hypothetical protein EMIT0P253_510009 [Pseudomonas sp. IT-P253]